MCTYIEVSTVKSVLVNHTAENPHKNKNKKTKEQKHIPVIEDGSMHMRSTRQVMYEYGPWAGEVGAALGQARQGRVATLEGNACQSSSN